GGPLASVTKAMKKAEAAIEDIFAEVVEAVESSESKRVAIDGVELLSAFAPDEFTMRLQLGDLKDRLARLDCTSLLTSQIREGREELSRVGMEEDVADGVIVLYYEGEGLTRDRALEIRKMRGTEHSNQLHFFNITDQGIVVKKIPEEPKKRSKKEMEGVGKPVGGTKGSEGTASEEL
ncbi:MAG: ATPase domain-containing protein, partial [Candidatus Hodarchaeaceae archaeon]|nr:ATPase domain-containing protein [Candidatus Hodarchaeaceae archaeon]